MIIKMSAVTLLYILLIVAMWRLTRDKKITNPWKVLIGLVFGLSSVLSTHYGISYEGMIINVRDLGPLSAGLFFSPVSGIIAGLIGGIERYIAGTYFGVGSYTRVACSVATSVAGFVAMGMNACVFKGKKPSPVYAFFMGAFMEVFHMYVVFITHRDDLRSAFMVVKICSVPMIMFTGIGLALSSYLLQVLSGEWRNPFAKKKSEEVPVSTRFQKWLFAVTFLVLVAGFFFSYYLQTGSEYQDSIHTIEESATHIKQRILDGNNNIEPEADVSFDHMILADGYINNGTHKGMTVGVDEANSLKSLEGKTVKRTYLGKKSLLRVEAIDLEHILVVSMTNEQVYWYRDAQAYETGLSSILLFTVTYVLIAYLVNRIVVNNIQKINGSLSKITNGNLDEVVDVRSSSEFAELSDDINETVMALKGYISAAEKKMEQELTLARIIQDSSLPKSFNVPDRDEIEIYATMKPAKEVGGDFYDFFHVDVNRMAFVIADVSGKGIPAALVMMRSKTAIRTVAQEGGTPADIIEKTNEALCEGNDAEMFVTAWIGILDLPTGLLTCANAGHEYPAIKRAGGEYELYKDKHSLALAAMDGLKAKQYDIELEPGDKVFVYSDGIPEAINENVEQYGTERMIEALNLVKNETMRDTLPAITESVNIFKGKADQFDDMTMLGFEFRHYSKV